MTLNQLIVGKIQYLEHQNKQLASLSKKQLELLTQTNASPKEFIDFYNDIKIL